MRESALRKYLQEESVLCLATYGVDGPYSTPLFYTPTADPRTLLFVSDPRSLHGRHLAHDPRAAAGIYTTGACVAEIRGAQLRGWAMAAPSAEEAALRTLYVERFPEASVALGQGGHRCYRFVWDWAKWTDNREGFGTKVVFDHRSDGARPPPRPAG